MTNGKISEEVKAKAAEYALECMSSGCNCAESTILGLIKAEVIDMPSTLGVKLACGFGGGGGRAGNSCGALCGGLLALNWTYGREDPFAIESADDRRKQLGEYTYVYANNYTKRFVDTNGTALCKEVIERNGGYPSEGQKQDCFKIVRTAVEHACDMIGLTDEEIKALPQGFSIDQIGK